MRGKGESAVYRVPADRDLPLKYWQAVIELPSRDGKRRQKFIRRKDKAELLTELGKAREALRARGDLPTADMSVEQWFTYWFDQVVLPNARPKTAAGYRSVIFNHIIPTIGRVRLEKLTAQHVRKVYDGMTAKGLASTYALNAHRIMHAAFKIAIREGKIGRNPADLVDPPRKSKFEAEAFTLQESLQVLRHVSRDPIMGTRWATGLMTGARRGEVIGLEVDRVGDLIDFSWQLQRITYAHGCKTPCGGKRGADCPDRTINVPHDYDYRHITGGLYWTRPKSDAGWRIVPCVDPLRTLLEQHMARTPENPWGLVFVEDNYPLDPDQDSRAWREVLAATGIDKDVRGHDLRHTTVDLLYLAEVPEDLIQEIVGHSTRAMSRAYKTRSNTLRLREAMLQFSAQFAELTPTDGARSETLAAVE